MLINIKGNMLKQNEGLIRKLVGTQFVQKEKHELFKGDQDD